MKKLIDTIRDWYLRKQGIEDKHDKEYMIVKNTTLDEITGEYEDNFSLQRRVNFTWNTLKSGFKTYADALMYYTKIQEHLEKTKEIRYPIEK